MSEAAAHAAIETAARDSRARLLAFVAARAGGDLASAEDALSEAFLAAVRQWPAEGVPDRPEAWLVAAAQRRLIDAQRRAQVRASNEENVRSALEIARGMTASASDFPDERLALLFVCAHPAIDAAARAPLMLQVVLGLDVARIASVFLVAPSAMAQRLVRAKARIRLAGVPFSVPAGPDLPDRVAFVLDAIYAAYTADWTDAGSPAFAREALALARVLAGLMPDEPEAHGLLALLLFSESRRAARSAAGGFVPLAEQDPATWDRARIQEAEDALFRAAAVRRPGRFQIEAAIQSAHAQRRRREDPILWSAILPLYGSLVALTPGIGARIGRAVAVGEVHGPAAGLAALDEIPSAARVSHQPYWAARADLLRRLPDAANADLAYRKAVALTAPGPVRDFLERRRMAAGRAD